MEDRYENKIENRYEYNGSERFRPLSPWAYFGYGVLFSIPVIGLILVIVFSLSDGNVNRRNFARSFLIGLLVAVILTAILSAVIWAYITPHLSEIQNAIKMVEMVSKYV